jgi:hypothetical protein
LNLQPADYKSAALPLSYIGNADVPLRHIVKRKNLILEGKDGFVNVTIDGKNGLLSVNCSASSHLAVYRQRRMV